MTGAYIVGEGNDGTGKSTQIDLLASYIKEQYGLEVLVLHEPDGCPISSEIRKIIKNGSLERDATTNLLLFTASRHETWFRDAIPALERGGVVLSARNELSSEVYQGVAEGLGVEFVRSVTKTFMDEHYMNPELTVVFTLDDEVRRARIAARGELKDPDTFESRDGKFQADLNRGYQSIATERGLPTIDASRPIDDIQQEFRELATKVLIEKGLVKA